MEGLFIKYISESYYTNALAVLVAFCVCIYITRYPNKEVDIFKYYLSFYIIGQVIHFYCSTICTSASSEERASFYSKATECLFTTVEFLIFHRYYRTLLATPRFEKCIIWTRIAYLILTVGVIASDTIRNSTITTLSLQRIFVFQAIALILLSSMYFINVFRSPPQNIINVPAFWISTGLYVCMLPILPFTLFLKDIMAAFPDLYWNFFTITYVVYIVLFLMILKAHSCKTIQ